jgi:hypothetical protein
MPGGLETAEIDPRTGELAAPDSPNKRTELFLSGTAPTAGTGAAPEDETVTEGDDGKGDGGFDYEPAPLPESQPEAAPRKPPKLEGRGVLQQDGSTRLQGTITLDIDPTTGLIADPAVCPIIRSRTFIIGQEPRKYCGPEYHNGKTVQPSESRPRVVSPR